ncbi:MAG TPA: phosphoribosyltransferase [Patescibacteria group bacterium]|nr:phosphoribosyltransferase [Patescibacteria group bacterium]
MYYNNLNMVFADRKDAGEQLAEKLLSENITLENSILLALPRGGIPVAVEIHKMLKIPYDILISRKLGSPGNPEFGFGAISENNTIYLNRESIFEYGITEKYINDIVNKEKNEMQRRIDLYRKGKQLTDLNGKIAILVDDGIATGVTTKAAIQAANSLGAKEVWICTPVCPKDTYLKLQKDCTKIISLLIPEYLFAIGEYYKKFDQLSDDVIINILNT